MRTSIAIAGIALSLLATGCATPATYTNKVWKYGNRVAVVQTCGWFGAVLRICSRPTVIKSSDPRIGD